MIELDISTAVAIYLFMTVVGLLLLWLLFDRETKPKQYNTPEKKSIWQCEICTFSYVDSQHDVISKCPQCGSFNKRKEQDI